MDVVLRACRDPECPTCCHPRILAATRRAKASAVTRVAPARPAPASVRAVRAARTRVYARGRVVR